MSPVPPFIARRGWWLVLLLGWAVVVGASLQWQLRDLRRQSLEVATEGARNMFRMVVLVRSWNSAHGGIYLPVAPDLPPNPYLDHPRRDLTTVDGQALTLVNPAYMTRLLSEMAAARGGAVFHITSLKPIRPKNAPDDWERQALAAFAAGAREMVQMTPGADGQVLLRYMAPLYVEQPCLTCHERQGYQLGDVRGGISVTQPYGPVEEASRAGRRQAWWLHGSAFLLVAVAGGLLLELLRRRWRNLADNIAVLEDTRNDLLAANRSLGQARDAAEAASRAKTAFLANMSHELRTPLNAVVGFTHLLRIEDPDPQRQEMLRHIDVASGQLLEMIDQVLSLSHLEAGDMDLVLADFDLDGLLAKAFSRLTGAAREKSLTCRLERDPRLPARLHGDPRRIGQILDHYTSNAVKFSERGEIVLAAGETGRHEGRIGLRLEVRDQGIGLSAEQVGRLFTSFEQADMSTTRRYGGAGLGLAICRRLAELMGGQVGVHSIPGAGSRFWIDLELPAPGQGPAMPPGAGSPAPAQAPDAATLQALLDQFDRLLATDDMAAATFWQQHQDRLAPRLGDQADVVAREVAAYRFDEALKSLRAALRA